MMGITIILYSEEPYEKTGRSRRLRKGEKVPDFTIEVLEYRWELLLSEFVAGSAVARRLPQVARLHPYGSDAWFDAESVGPLADQLEQAIRDPHTDPQFLPALRDLLRMCWRCRDESLVLGALVE